MNLQTNNLVMVGLGVKDDLPPNELQPKLDDGVHLRWGFKQDKGFPKYGFYLFRRYHIIGKQIDLQNSLQEIAQEEPVPILTIETYTVQTTFGNFISDNKIIFSKDYPPKDQAEVSLYNGTYLKYNWKHNEPVRFVELTIIFREKSIAGITVYSNYNTIDKNEIRGNSGEKKSIVFEYDRITSIKIDKVNAVLINLAFIPVLQNATTGWETIGKTAISLPLIHPDYPCTGNGAENLNNARTKAKNRIHYGDANHFTSSSIKSDTGTVQAQVDSPIITGTGTNWNTELVGSIFTIKGEYSGYTIIRVISENKLVLSRKYIGTSGSGKEYIICEDNFGQLHDNLVHLVSKSGTPLSMAEKLFPQPRYSQGLITINSNDQVVHGSSTDWSNDFENLYIQIEHDENLYKIKSVESFNKITLEQIFTGATVLNKNYLIVDVFEAEDTSENTPKMPVFHPLEQILISALQPAIAQMLGLYRIDSTAQDGREYDYLIVADYNGIGDGKWDNIRNEIQQNSFANLDGYIVFKKKKEKNSLPCPNDLKVFALPATSGFSKQSIDPNRQNCAGLRWQIESIELGMLKPDSAIMYHVWRTFLGNEQQPLELTDSNYELITKTVIADEEQLRPIIVTVPKLEPGQELQHPSDWPPFPLHFIDNFLQEGWHSYKVSGIDIFGRHSSNSEACQWYQWEPEPDPLPWYYTEPPTDRLVEQGDGSKSAVRLLDKIPPPPPVGVEAFVLDPGDPTVLQDAAYQAWREEAGDQAVGLRIRWKWTEALFQQAPDIKEFRIYYQPGHINVLLGHTKNVDMIRSSKYKVETDILSDHPDNFLQGASLRIGCTSYKIFANDKTADGFIRLKVKCGPSYSEGTIAVENGSPKIAGTNTAWDKNLIGLNFKIENVAREFTVLNVASDTELELNELYYGETGEQKNYEIFGNLPTANSSCSIVIPQHYSAGRIQVINGSNTVRGLGTDWGLNLVNMLLYIKGNPKKYKIKNINNETQIITLDRPYVGTARYDSPCSYVIDFPVYTNYGIATNWLKRLYIVDYEEHFSNQMLPAIDPNDNHLVGSQAIKIGNGIALLDNPDLSNIRLSAEDQVLKNKIYLENDTAREDKLYEIVNISTFSPAIGDPVVFLALDETPQFDVPSSPWIIGIPIRQYEVFLPAPDTADGEPFKPTIIDPLVYADIGATAVNDKTHTLDDPKWGDPPLGERTGNESKVSTPSKIFRIDRTPPPQPVQLPFEEGPNIYASKADYHGISFYTYRWQPQQYMKTHIYRALDDALFKLDLKIRLTRSELSIDNPQHSNFFPTDEEIGINDKSIAATRLNSISKPEDYDDPLFQELDWRILRLLPGNSGIATDVEICDDFEAESRDKKRNDLKNRDWLIRSTRKLFSNAEEYEKYFPKALRGAGFSNVRQQICDTINGITTRDNYNFTNSECPQTAMMIIANLPGNEPVFKQQTIKPLDPEEPDPVSPTEKRWRDRVGPDLENPEPNYVPQDNLRAFIDKLDGRSIARYFYRIAYVSPVHVKSPLGLSSPPVYLPDEILPAKPRLFKALGGNRQVTLIWGAHRESVMHRYLIYRTEDKVKTRDTRLMGEPVANLPATELVAVGGEVDLGSGTDIVMVERVYESAEFDPKADLLSGQSAAQFLSTPTAPTGQRITGITAADNTHVVVVYRDSKQGIQYSPWGNAPRIWIDKELVGAHTYFYRIVATRHGETGNGSMILNSLPSDVGAGRAVDLTPPEPPTWISAEWIQISSDFNEFAFMDPIPLGETRKPAVKLIWSSHDYDLSTLIQQRRDQEPIFTNVTDWLPQGTTTHVITGLRPHLRYRFRIYVLNAAGNRNEKFNIIMLNPVINT